MTVLSFSRDTRDFPGESVGKESPCNVGGLGLVPGFGRYPGRGHGNPLQYSCLENHHGHRSLAGYSPWDHTESDMTEQLSTQFILSILRHAFSYPEYIYVHNSQTLETNQTFTNSRRNN